MYFLKKSSLRCIWLNHAHYTSLKIVRQLQCDYVPEDVQLVVQK